MTMTRRDKRALIFLAAGLGAIALYFGAVEPLWGAYGDLVSEHGHLARQVARLKVDKDKVAWYETQIPEWTERYGPYSELKPYHEQITRICEQISAAAGKSGFKMKAPNITQPSAWGEDASLATATVHLDAESGWENVFKFISHLHRIPGVLSIEHLEMNADAKNGNKINIKLTVSVMVKAEPRDEAIWAS